jgi:ABC-type phosphate transport system substrate-binding protein
MPGAANASLGAQCSGANITGQGANVAKLAHQTVWDPAFNTSKSRSACSGTQGSKGKPVISYTTSSAATGLESWGANKHVGSNFSSTNAFIGASEPPNALQISEIESYETTPTPNTVASIPTFQTALAVIVNLPANCTATSKKNAGRLELDNVTLEGIFRGTITKWSQITADGDKLSGAGCNPESAIQPVVRLDGAGTTHIFKRYLSLINGASFTDEKEASQTWTGTSEGLLNTDWPKAANVVRPSKTGDTAIDTKVAETPGSISYTTLAEARANGSFMPSPGTGGAGTASSPAKRSTQIQRATKTWPRWVIPTARTPNTPTAKLRSRRKACSSRGTRSRRGLSRKSTRCAASSSSWPSRNTRPTRARVWKRRRASTTSSNSSWTRRAVVARS